MKRKGNNKKMQRRARPRGGGGSSGGGGGWNPFRRRPKPPTSTPVAPTVPGSPGAPNNLPGVSNATQQASVIQGTNNQQINPFSNNHVQVDQANLSYTVNNPKQSGLQKVGTAAGIVGAGVGVAASAQSMGLIEIGDDGEAYDTNGNRVEFDANGNPTQPITGMPITAEPGTSGYPGGASSSFPGGGSSSFPGGGSSSFPGGPAYSGAQGFPTDTSEGLSCKPLDCYAKCRQADKFKLQQCREIQDDFEAEMKAIGCSTTCKTKSNTKTCSKKRTVRKRKTCSKKKTKTCGCGCKRKRGCGCSK